MIQNPVLELFFGDGWYFRARRRFLSRLVLRFVPPGARVLDVGCGDGWLGGVLPGRAWLGVEPNPVLLEMGRARGLSVLPGRAEFLPFPDASFDAACLFDVLEHLGDDAAALREARRVLRPGGVLLASVPLHPGVWSAHDEACGHLRRYRRGELARLLEASGFRVLERRFFVSLLLPAACLARRLGSGGPGRLPGLLDRLAEGLLLLDALLCLPFGLTEVAAARAA